MVPAEMSRAPIYSVFVLFLGLRCLAVEFQTNCPQDYLQYGERTCFKFLSDTQNSFEDSSRYCQDQEAGMLITISDHAQHNLISTYTKLYTTQHPYWVGLRYNNSVLTDIDGAVVDAGLFSLEYRPGEGECVSVISDDGDVKFSQMDCNVVNNFICLKKWPVPPYSVDITGTPVGYSFIGATVIYGVPGDDVQLTCQFSIPEDDWSAEVTAQWRFEDEDIDGASDVLTSGMATHTITAFQLTDEGMYSCVVSTAYWSVSSTNLLVKKTESPSIERPPQNVTVHVGQQGFFECEPTDSSFPVPNVAWYKDGVVLDIGEQQFKYFVSPNTKTLLVSHVDDSDIGAYHCVLSNPAGQFSSDAKYLNVIPTTNDSKIEIKLGPQPLTVLVGEDATFDCIGSDSSNHTNAIYSWLAYSSDGLIEEETLSVNASHNFSYQTYSDIQLDSIASVQCVFQGVVHSSNATLTVKEQAYITDISDDDAIQYGSDVDLTCTFKGRPSPVAEWLFNGQPVNQEDYKTIGSSSVLTIKNFQPNHVGVYQCRVSNCPYHSHTKSVNLYGTDGQPGAVLVSLLALNKSQVSVGWWPLSQSNSEPQLIQYQVTWSNVNDKSTATQTRQFPPTANNYTITDLVPGYHLSVTVVAVTPNREGVLRPPILIYPLGNAPDHPPRSVHVLRYHDNDDDSTDTMEISWEAVVPDHNKGEGEMIAYEVQYRNYGMDTGTTIGHISSDITSITIYGLAPGGYYEVRVRCAVMTQISPLEVESCPWSEWVEADGTPTGAPVKSSDGNANIKVAIPVAIIAVALIVLLGVCVLYRIWKWAKPRRRNSTTVAYSSMKNENVEDDDLPVEAHLDSQLEISVRKDLA